MSNYQDVGILEDLGRRYNRNSPDYLERKLEGQIPVFVYGTLRQGFSNHGLLKDLPYLGRGVSAIEKFEMREPHHGGFPLLFENGQRTNSANVMSGKVHGEVYVVDPLTLLELDRLEGNGYMYARSKQWITLRDQQVPSKTNNFRPCIQAWTYIACKPFWRDRVTTSVPSKMVNSVRQYDWADSFMNALEEIPAGKKQQQQKKSTTLLI